jgi:hypothetical protein
MKLRYLSVLGLTALFLLVLEVGLEARAHRRGFGSILFGQGQVRLGDTNLELPPQALGPQEGFPFRSRVVAREKDPGIVRIWLGSASHGEDVAVPVPQLFPNRMGDLLGDSVQVLNASRAGLTLGGNARELRETGEDWAPDYAILYGLSMDLGNLSRTFLAETPPSPDPGEGGDVEVEPQGSVSGPFTYLDRLYEETTVYAQLKSNLTTLVTRQRVLADSLPQGAFEPFKAVVERFVDAAEEVGAIPVLTTFATSHGWNGPEPLPLAAEKFMVRYNPYLKPSGWVKAIHDLNEVFREVARERDVALIELEPGLTNHPALFRDPVHFTVDGHDEVARRLAAGLEEAFPATFPAPPEPEPQPAGPSGEGGAPDAEVSFPPPAGARP